MNLNFLKRIINILLIPPLLFFANQLSGQCDVFIEPGSIEVVDNGTGVQFIFDVTNNSAVEYDGGDLNMAWTLNSPTFPATIWEIDFTTNTTANSIQPGETRTLRTPWLDIPNLPSWFPSNPDTPGSNFELWVDALEWPFWSANPNGFDGSWDEVRLFLDDCDPEYIYNDDGSFYYGPTDSDCPNVNGDQFCDCEIDFIDFNHYTYEATLQVNGWQNCATPLNNGSTGNIDNINSVVFGIHIPDWDYGWGDCVGNDDDTYPGWTFALFNNLNIDSSETVVIDIDNSSASVIPCWLEILEDPDLPCREVVIWQINFSRTARIEDFPDEGWVSNPFLNSSTAAYPDINIPNNRITYCNTPNAYPPYTGLNVECVDNEAVFEYNIYVNNNGLDTLFNYCVEIPELDYNECFNGYLESVYYVAPNQGQFLGTIQIPNNVTEFNVIVYDAEDELDEFYFDNSIVIDLTTTNLDDECEVYGCMDTMAINYNPLATLDDGSCEYNDVVDIGVDSLGYQLGGCFGEPLYWIPEINITNYGDVTVTELCLEFYIWNVAGVEPDTLCFDNLNILPGQSTVLELPQNYNGGDDLLLIQTTLISSNGTLEPFQQNNTLNSQFIMWCYDCIDPDAENYNEFATNNQDPNNCEYLGCTDWDANNYDPQATIDDGSCEYLGCTDSSADNYDPNANVDDGSCEYLGCTDNSADNYDPNANVDDGSCEYLGCTDPQASNYDPQANVNDGSCDYLGCTDPQASNYDPQATIDDGSCDYLGCTDSNALNYDPQATIDDGSCLYDILGCTDPNADNYDPDATIDDNSCIYFGCTDPEAFNYDPTANTDDNSCMYYGCTDSDADNYDPNADINDGSCQYLGCTDSEALNYDPDANVDDGNCVYPPYVDPCDDADIYVPNTFTPDNDGLNDVWFVSTTPDCWRSFDIRVYDRWGQLVWETEDVNDVWLGGFTGGTHFVADGIYIYQIIAHKWNTEVHQSSGFVTIIR